MDASNLEEKYKKLAAEYSKVIEKYPLNSFKSSKLNLYKISNGQF